MSEISDPTELKILNRELKQVNEKLIKKNPKIKKLLETLNAKEDELKSPIEEGNQTEDKIIYKLKPFQRFWNETCNEKFYTVE